MKEKKYIRFNGKHFVLIICGFLFLFPGLMLVHAQEKPPAPIALSVYLEQGLNFGAFAQGVAGGTIYVYTDGSRSVAGDIIMLNLGFLVSPIIFLVDANLGTIVSILPVSEVTLTGSNGGTLILHIGDTDPVLPFITTTLQTQIRMGGALTVGNPGANPPGAYSGSFSVTFVQE
jgi:hypothetical protein